MLTFFRNLCDSGVPRDLKLEVVEVLLTIATSSTWTQPIPVLELRPRIFCEDDGLFSWREPSLDPIAQVPILHTGQPEWDMDLLRGYGHAERLIKENKQVIIEADFSSSNEWARFSHRFVARARIR